MPYEYQNISQPARAEKTRYMQKTKAVIYVMPFGEVIYYEAILLK